MAPASDKAGRPRASHQLPPGRHGLDRSYVTANQLERILDAVADVVSFKGYVAMSVEDIVSAAGVSRRTFYDNFRSKEDAYLASFDAIGAEAVRRVAAAYDASASFPEGVVACLRAFLELAASETRYADMCLVEVLAAGPAAIARRNAVMRSLAELLQRGAETMPDAIHPPALTAETVIGGIYEVVRTRVLQGQATDLVGLLPDLAYSMMLPYMGHEATDRVMAELGATI